MDLPENEQVLRNELQDGRLTGYDEVSGTKWVSYVLSYACNDYWRFSPAKLLSWGHAGLRGNMWFSDWEGRIENDKTSME